MRNENFQKEILQNVRKIITSKEWSVKIKQNTEIKNTKIYKLNNEVRTKGIGQLECKDKLLIPMVGNCIL